MSRGTSPSRALGQCLLPLALLHSVKSSSPACEFWRLVFNEAFRWSSRVTTFCAKIHLCAGEARKLAARELQADERLQARWVWARETARQFCPSANSRRA